MGTDEKRKTPLEALEAFFHTYKRLLGHMARGMCKGNVTAAQDLVQDTMVRMIEQVEKGELDPSVDSFPFVTEARRHMANRRKHNASKAENRRTAVAPEGNPVEDGPSSKPNPEAALIAKTEQLMKAEVFDQVREILTGIALAVFDLSMEDVFDEKTQAERLGLTVTQVNNARRTIREKAAQVLARHGMEMPELRKKKSHD
jgi:RNA polymerase sigma factor (sigma-70 family)